MLTIYKIESIQTSGNCYIVSNEKDCIIIDPGFNNEEEKKKLKSYIERNQLKPIKIILTHWHYDHVIGCYDLQKEYNIPIYIHKKDRDLLKLTSTVSLLFGIIVKTPKNNIIEVSDNDIIKFGNSHLKVINTPGHSKGSICLYDEKNNICYTGDTLFDRSIGRTDFPGGNKNEMKNSLEFLIKELPNTCRIYPGHGNDFILKNNIPFIKQIIETL